MAHDKKNLTDADPTDLRTARTALRPFVASVAALGTALDLVADGQYEIEALAANQRAAQKARDAALQEAADAREEAARLKADLTADIEALTKQKADRAGDVQRLEQEKNALAAAKSALEQEIENIRKKLAA